MAIAFGARTARIAADGVPSRLSDAEFWQLVTTLSEPDGTFRSENFVSNELYVQESLPRLTQLAGAGRAYLGVGPEQNFTYIAALNPSIAFIVDVRRGNLDLQLMYKALFELAADRAEFLSLLFSRPRPAGLEAGVPPARLLEAYAGVAPGSEELFRGNLASLRRQLLTAHRFPMTEGDFADLEHVYRAFYTEGPAIRFSLADTAGGTIQPTFAELMTATDGSGVPRAFLATEEQFAAIKAFESRNLVVPIVGDFAGPTALRAIGRYLRDRGTTVSAFYVSNVEEYLMRDHIWTQFCKNVAMLPLDEASTIVRSVLSSAGGAGSVGYRADLLKTQEVVRGCAPAR